ncbi:MAG: transcription termination/antitermination protein NusG [Gammaproteobacteria bacterium]|nr:transcription termination/antitermination protein NusG [Gammaproteobacteria bacterium]
MEQPLFDRAVLDDPNKKWYVVSAQAGQEKRAAATLEERVKYSDLAEKFGAILVPSEEVVELRGGKRRRSERRFYPGYIFINMEMDETTWELVTKTTRISGFVGGTIAKPTPLPKAEIQLILDRIDQGGEKVTPKTVFEPGELIRIIDGPFNEFSGTVEEVNYKKQQLVVAVTIFGRSTPVELDFSQVEKG